MLLSAADGGGGVLPGAAATVGYALATGQAVELPAGASLGGLGLAVLVGIVAGVYLAARAARLPPTEALRSAV